MKLNPDLFPYPVLHSDLDDYVNSKFKADIQLVEETPFKIIYKISFALQDEGLEALVEENRACFAVHVEGEASSYRKLFKVSKNELDIEIPLKTDEISKNVFINNMLIAKDDIINYSNSNFNPLYYGEKLVIPKIEKGEILAFENTVELNFEFENRENPSARSMIQIADGNDDVMKIDISGDKIIVYLPSKDYQAYFQLSGASAAKQKLLLVTVVLPTLTYVLERLATGGANDSTLEWVNSIVQLLEDNNISIAQLKDDPARSLEYAQKLLNSPVKNSLFNIFEEESISYE